MNTLEIKRRTIFKEILDEEDENVLSKIITYIHDLKQNTVLPPCCFTDDEKLARIEQSLRDVKAGLGVAHEDVFKKYFDENRE